MRSILTRTIYGGWKMDIAQDVALEIFSNPDDLSFGILEDLKKKTFGFMISRGPGKNFRYLVRKEDAQFESVDAAADEIGRILNAVVEMKFPSEESSALTKERVQSIVTALKARQYFGTYHVY